MRNLSLDRKNQILYRTQIQTSFVIPMSDLYTGFQMCIQGSGKNLRWSTLQQQLPDSIHSWE